MKKIVMIASIALWTIACNKNQRAVNKLDGSWEATKWVASDGYSSADLIATGELVEANMTFSSCKLKKDEWCSLTSTFTLAGEPTVNSSQFYRVTVDGTKLETKENSNAIAVTNHEIVEMTGKSLKIKHIDIDGSYEATFEKK